MFGMFIAQGIPKPLSGLGKGRLAGSQLLVAQPRRTRRVYELESIGFLVNDILNCIRTAGLDLPETLTASGGGAKSSLLQFTANITGKTISHSLFKDKTAFGIYRILSSNNLNQISKEATGDIFYPEKIPTLKGKIDKWEQGIKVLEKL